MRIGRKTLALSVAVIAVAGAALSPALGASSEAVRKVLKHPVSLSARGGIGSFTPAGADPRVAALFARAGLAHSGFRFTPAGAARSGDRAVTVAVRAMSTTSRSAAERAAAAAPSVSITPVAYNLGVSVGWRRFALSGDVARVDMAGLPGSREKVDVGVSYNTPKWSTRLQVGKDRPTDSLTKLTEGNSVSFDLGGSYSLTRNLDVTAGVRYKSELHNRLPQLTDDRRDSQAVYIGTAFKF